MSNDDWVCIINDDYNGTVRVSMYETTMPTHERRTISKELTVSQMVAALEAIQRSLAYHLRMLT